MWGCVMGKVWQFNKKTGLWNKCNQATICAKGVPIATSSKGEYGFTLPGGTQINSMTCDKIKYKQWIYPSIPFVIKTNVAIKIDIYMI